MKEHSGVYPAIVIDNVDPENSGRLKVRLPQIPVSGGNVHEAWARMATLMAGVNRGTWFVPDLNDEVMVAFEEGDVRRPYVLGALWNGANRPPASMDAGNNTKLLRSRNGLKITLDDGPGAVVLTDSNGNSLKLGPSGITINAAAKVAINAGAVEVNAGIVSVNAAISKFSGIVQCDLLISNSVVSQSYTPGAGNIW